MRISIPEDSGNIRTKRINNKGIGEGKTENAPPYKWFGGVGKQHPFALESGKQYHQMESVICYGI